MLIKLSTVLSQFICFAWFRHVLTDFQHAKVGPFQAISFLTLFGLFLSSESDITQLEVMGASM